jgi:iron complex outermembrane receptor protein
VDAGVRYVAELPNQKIPSYLATDARLGWRPVPSLEISAVGQNLFDSRHPEFGTPASRKEVERSLYGRATWTY